jgi:cell division protein FtsW
MTDFTATLRQATRLDEIGGRYDAWLLAISCVLACLGVVMVGSASIAIAEGRDAGPFYYLTRHVAFVAVGAGLAILAMRTEMKTMEQYSRYLPIAALVLLMLVVLPGIGYTAKGARRWLNLGIGTFQPVEAVKLMLIVWLSSYLARFRDEVSATWKAMIKVLAVAGLLVGILLVIHKDFGSSALLLAITAGMLVLGGANLPRMLLPVLCALPVLALMILMEPYRVQRLVSYRDPWADPFGSGYQLTNALMAVGRGEWFGVGLGASVQKLSYLPEAHTDFILAVIAEELGFVGVLAIIVLYAALAGRAFWIGLKCVEMRRHFAGYVAFGIALWMSLQSFVSIGVNLGLLPTKGLTLPLISSGGSSVMMTCAALGVLLRVSFELDRAQRQVARLRGEAAMPAAAMPATSQPLPVATAETRGASRLRQRVEPVFGKTAGKTA